MAEVFLKGSAYSIPFLVKSGKTTITNENVASVRLGLGNLTASWRADGSATAAGTGFSR